MCSIPVDDGMNDLQDIFSKDREDPEDWYLNHIDDGEAELVASCFEAEAERLVNCD